MEEKREKSQVIRGIGWIVAIIVFIIGLVSFLENYEYIEYTSYFGRDVVEEFSWSPAGTSGFKLMQDWGNKAVIGAVVMIGAVVLLVVFQLIANNVAMLENSNAQTEIIKATATPAENAHEITVSEKFQQLETLKAQGLISDEEYNKKRNELISRL